MTSSNRWRWLRRRIAREPYSLVDLSDDGLLQLLKHLDTPRAAGALEQIQEGRLTLIEACLQLLSNNEQITTEEFVRRAYQGLLGREPDEQGFRDYVSALSGRQTSRWGLVAALLCSDEFRAVLSKERDSYGLPPWATRPSIAISAIADAARRILYPEFILPPLLMRRAIGEELSDLLGLHFKLTGLMFVERLVEDAHLSPESHVLDLGSGCGRIAIPLIGLINPPGSYFGIEAKGTMVRWCRRKITARFPHFQFVHCDVYNGLYNPKATVTPENYQFPFTGRQFDVVIATSLFTHLPPDAVENYARESGRVLKPGGRLFGTFFLVENGSRSADARLNFTHELSDAALTVNRARPEEAIAYRFDWVSEVFQASGLELLPPVRWGNWAGRSPAYLGQDVLLFRKHE